MRSAIGLLALVVTSSSVLADDARKQPTPDAKGQDLNEHAALLEPIQVDSLTLTPIVSTGTSTDPGDLLVLDEAMPAKQVRITEFNEGDVNNLTLVNSADKPVFLLAGEVIIGGKQDRIIGRNTIIPAKTKQQVPVYCVEHGRWEGSTKEFSTAKALAHGRLRGRANFDDQSAVWAEGRAKNEARKTQNSTDTYRKVATQQSDGSNKDWQTRVDAAIANAAQAVRDRTIGYAVTLDGNDPSDDVLLSTQPAATASGPGGARARPLRAAGRGGGRLHGQGRGRRLARHAGTFQTGDRDIEPVDAGGRARRVTPNSTPRGECPGHRALRLSAEPA